MALSHEDKKDVKGAMGKAMANKITKDKYSKEEAAEKGMMSRLKSVSKGVKMTRKFLD